MAGATIRRDRAQPVSEYGCYDPRIGIHVCDKDEPGFSSWCTRVEERESSYERQPEYWHNPGSDNELSPGWEFALVVKHRIAMFPAPLADHVRPDSLIGRR